jgi:hypothetical protein
LSHLRKRGGKPEPSFDHANLAILKKEVNETTAISGNRFDPIAAPRDGRQAPRPRSLRAMASKANHDVTATGGRHRHHAASAPWRAGDPRQQKDQAIGHS